MAAVGEQVPHTAGCEACVVQGKHAQLLQQGWSCGCQVVGPVVCDCAGTCTQSTGVVDV